MVAEKVDVKVGMWADSLDPLPAVMWAVEMVDEWVDEMAEQ